MIKNENMVKIYTIVFTRPSSYVYLERKFPAVTPDTSALAVIVRGP
jgi:hypothetical protein